MADANIDQTVFIPATDIVSQIENYNDVGVVVYTKAFPVNGHQIWMVPSQ